jgi:hypothetical protein
LTPDNPANYKLKKGVGWAAASIASDRPLPWMGNEVSDTVLTGSVCQHSLKYEVQGESIMRIRLTQLSLALVTTLFCTVSFSATPMDTGSATQGPLLLAEVEKKPVCHLLPQGKFQDQELPADTADKLTEEKPNKWFDGTCAQYVSEHMNNT